MRQVSGGWQLGSSVSSWHLLPIKEKDCSHFLSLQKSVGEKNRVHLQSSIELLADSD